MNAIDRLDQIDELSADGQAYLFGWLAMNLSEEQWARAMAGAAVFAAEVATRGGNA